MLISIEFRDFLSPPHPKVDITEEPSLRDLCKWFKKNMHKEVFL